MLKSSVARATALWLSLHGSLASAGASLELLGPSGAISPDGFSLALRRAGDLGRSAPLVAPEVTFEGAELLPGPPLPPLRTFQVKPRPGAKLVRIRARDGGLLAEAVFGVGPPAARVELALNPAAPVKNRDVSAVLSVRILRSDGTADPDSAPPALRANVGAIESLERVGPGAYRARYLLPRTRYPEVAVLVALSAWPHPQSVHGSFGSLRVPLASAIDLPGQTEPAAELTVTIAGVKSGPVRAGADGRFKVPVVVPPGFGVAKATAVDRIGNRRTSSIDLALPPTDQLSCVMSPNRLPADGTSMGRVLCATSDPFGRALEAARVTLIATRGTLSPPKGQEGGITEWIYTAPRQLSSEPDLLSAAWRQGRVTSRDELRVELVQGPATQVEIEVEEPLVHYGGRLPLTVRIKDELGRLRRRAELRLRPVALPAGEGHLGGEQAAFGTFAPPIESGPGVLTTHWLAPATGNAAGAELGVFAYGPTGSEPARIITWAQDGGLFAAVTDLAGLPVPNQPLRGGAGDFLTGADGTARLGAPADGTLDIHHGRWPGLRATVHVRDGAALVFPPGVGPATPSARLRVGLAPAVPLNVRLKVEGLAVTYWTEDAEGTVLLGRQTAVAVSGGVAGPSSQEAGRSTFTVALEAPATVSITDVVTGVTALAELRP